MKQGRQRRLVPRLNHLSIRTRLLLANVGLLFIGFLALTLVAGNQNALAARADYEQRLLNEVQLIGQGLQSRLTDETASTETLNALIGEYETHLNGTIALYSLNERNGGDADKHPGEPDVAHGGFRDAPEIEAAIRNGIVVVERVNGAGQPALFTAAPLVTSQRDDNPGLIVQVSVPLANLQALILQRWLVLLGVFAVVLVITVVFALGIARSIIRPLYALRESAVRLAGGDFSHRVRYANHDEIGEVAHAFNDMAVQVESMLEEQRAFASNTSHELRTPLTTIRLRTEALRFNPSLEPEIARQYIDEIDDEVMRLGHLVQDLTLLSRFDAGRAEIGQEQIDMLRFATSLRHTLLPLSNEKRITLTLITPAEDLIVQASLTHLTVIFRNVLDNAIKYTPEGGTITWTIGAVAAGVQHTIADTGHGIEVEHLPHLFERFYRSDKARSRSVPGTGLGLALVKSIVEAYGGTITIMSAGSDQGTTVTVTLPRI